MRFNISAFTRSAISRAINQDSILVNGILQQTGEIHLANQETCFCFVADGVGGNKAGNFASHFVLDKIKTVVSFENIEQTLRAANEELLKVSKASEDIRGTASTLTGLMVAANGFKIVHAGDSKMLLLRDDLFFQVTNDMVLDEEKNSPIVSYFGGLDNYLKFDENIATTASQPGDLFLICSDGLLKAVPLKIVKSILKSEKDLAAKSQKLLENCAEAGNEDDASAILIHRTN